MVSAKETAEAYISNNPVMVFSKTWCPYCRATKELLEEKQKEIGFKYQVLELNAMDEGDAIQDALKEKSGKRTVPSIFINHRYIGGNDVIQAMGTELDEELKKAAAAADSSLPESS